jgi:hypothetical protein
MTSEAGNVGRITNGVRSRSEKYRQTATQSARYASAKARAEVRSFLKETFLLK